MATESETPLKRRPISTAGLDEQSLSTGEEEDHRIRDSVLEHECGDVIG